jgi:hypothetical protein
VLSENLRTVRRTVNPERDPDAQAMLEMLERHGSRAGTVFAEQPRPLAVPLGHAAGKGTELVVEKRRMRSDLRPASPIAILKKTPPDAVWTYGQTHAAGTIHRPLADTNFSERHDVKALENAAGHVWVRKNN